MELPGLGLHDGVTLAGTGSADNDVKLFKPHPFDHRSTPVIVGCVWRPLGARCHLL